MTTTDDFGAGYERMTFERSGPVLIATLNRPERLNAVDGLMHREIERFFREVDRDQHSSVVVLTGAGRGFCAGGDVSSMTGETGSPLHDSADAVRSSGWHLVEALLSVEKPVVAMVNGAAVGLGATLALMCDHALMADEAKIGDRHVQVGLVAGDGFAIIAALLVGLNRAKELAMLGRLLSGTEAAAMGLVARAVPTEDLREETLKVAQELAAQPPFALRATKVALNRLARSSFDQVLDISLAWEQRSMAREDHKEAARAWLERRGG